MSDGKFDETKGRAKEAVGDLTGDRDMKNEGKVDRAGGSLKDKIGDVTRKVKQVVNPDRK